MVDADAPADEEQSGDVRELIEPAGGVPDPLTAPAELARVLERMRGGSGPLAVDAERASGYRYSQRAYLVQLRREGVGTVLIDPTTLPDLAELGRAIGDAEWVLHAANQDLPCLAELGLAPAALFDTELAGRLLGRERVALGTMVEAYLGVHLAKQHSAADWSQRPLPHDWLAYAALDVELLVPLRDLLAAELDAAGKTEWARQEFEAVRLAPPAAGRNEPWRRTSGIHKVRGRRRLAAVRALWQARDEYARQRDIAPGRVLPDSAIVDAARNQPRTAADLAALPVFGGRRQRRQLGRWFGALEQARQLAEDELPPVNASRDADSPPPPARWRDTHPEAAARLAASREAVAVIAERHSVLAQNLLASDAVRRLAWSPPSLPSPPSASRGADAVAARLDELGARPWQIELTAGALASALAAAG